jgi:hypothetical protein
MTRTLMLLLAALASLAVATSALGSASRSAASKTSFKVQPHAVKPGGAVHVFGKAGSCAVGSQLTASSFAFPESASGGGALTGKVGKHHKFSIENYVRGNLTRGVYPVTASCGGVDLGVTANVRVK